MKKKDKYFGESFFKDRDDLIRARAEVANLSRVQGTRHLRNNYTISFKDAVTFVDAYMIGGYLGHIEIPTVQQELEQIEYETQEKQERERKKAILDSALAKIEPVGLTKEEKLALAHYYGYSPARG